MIDALKFVQGAVAKKDFIPALTHFRIQNGRIKGFNGCLGICSPINIDLDIAPKALQFVKAINACEEEISLHVDKNGKLCVRSGKFKTFVDCVDKANYPDFEPQGQFVELGKELVPALRKMEPFIGEDASRPWACGVLFEGESAFVTNNIVFVEQWLGYHFPVRVNIPAEAIRELIRIGKNPTRLQTTGDRVIFHYEDKQWLSTQVLTQPWPDITRHLNSLSMAGQKCVKEEFWQALAAVVPFGDEMNRCFFLGEQMATTAEPEVTGTAVKIKGLPEQGIYNGKHLLALQTVANSFNFDAYPNPVAFFGDGTRGLITGLRT